MKIESQLIAIIVAPECNLQKQITVYYKDHVTFYSDHSECDLCGSHGDIILDFDCLECGKYHRIIVHSW